MRQFIFDWLVLELKTGTLYKETSGLYCNQL